MGAPLWRAGPLPGCPAGSGTPDPPAAPLGRCLQTPHRAGDARRRLGSNRTLHHRAQLLSSYRSSSSCHQPKHLPFTEQCPPGSEGEGGRGWAGAEHPPIAAGSGTEAERGRGAGEARRGRPVAAVHVLLADTITQHHSASPLPPSPGISQHREISPGACGCHRATPQPHKEIRGYEEELGPKILVLNIPVWF